MALRTTDRLLWDQSRLDAEAIIRRLDRPDDKDSAFLRALVRWCSVAGIDDGTAAVMWLVETANGTSARWNDDLNPGGVGIPADTSVQPFRIASGDEAARVLVQCLYAAATGTLSAKIPLPIAAATWFDRVWLPKVTGPTYPRPTMLMDLNTRYQDTTGEWQAVWAWDSGYVAALMERAEVWLPNLSDQVPAHGGRTTIPITPAPQAPVIYNLVTDYWRFGLSRAQASAVLANKFPKRNGGRPRAIVLHIQDGITPGSLEYWAGVEASSTVMIQRDGSILRVIPEGDGPWTNGDVKSPLPAAYGLINYGGNVNNWSLTIEAEGVPGEAMSSAQLDAISWQVEDWLIRYPEIAASWQSNVLAHYMINTVDKRSCGIYRPAILTAVGAWIDTPVIVEPPEPPKAPSIYPKGMTLQLAKRLYGSVRVPWSRKTFGFDPARPECQAWLVWGKAQLQDGQDYTRADWPMISDIIRRGGNNVHVYQYSNGRVYERVLRKCEQ